MDLNNLPEGTMHLRIPIRDGMKFSLNDVNKHWSIRMKMISDFHREIELAIRAMQEEPKPFVGRVDFLFRYFWKSRILDSTNTVFMSKSVEDAIVRHGQIKRKEKKRDVIVKYGLLKTDTNECVRYSIQESVLMTKKERDLLDGDEMEVYIMPVS